MQTRREFGKVVAGGSLAVGIGTVSMGVSCNTVFNDILKYIPVALQAMTAILSVLSGGGYTITPAVTVALNLVKVALADLQADVSAYENAPADQKNTLLGKVSTAIAIAEGNIQQFWNDLNLPQNNIAGTVSGILGVILSTLAYFATQLPAPTNVAVKNVPNALPVTPKKRSVKEMKVEINTLLKPSGQQVY